MAEKVERPRAETMASRMKPWRMMGVLFGTMLLLAAFEEKFGLGAFIAGGLLAGWYGVFSLAVVVKPSRAGRREGDAWVIRPAWWRRVIMGSLFLPLGVPALMDLGDTEGAEHAIVWGAIVLAFGLNAALFVGSRRSIRLVDGGFVQVGVTGNAVTRRWSDVKRVEYVQDANGVVFFVRREGDEREHDVLFPATWDGCGLFAASALAHLSREILPPDSKVRVELEYWATHVP